MHPIHPILVHFPVAFLLAGSAGHAIFAFTGLEQAWEYSLWLTGGGLCAALPAALAGAYDLYMHIVRPARKDSYAAAAWHATVMITAVMTYGACFLYTYKTGMASVNLPVLLILSLGAAGILTAGGYLGGEMVYRHGVGRISEKNSE